MVEVPRIGDRRVKPIGRDELKWINDDLLHRTRNLTLVTAGLDGNGTPDPHGTILYSAITRRFSRGRSIQQIWRSHGPESDVHSAHIERDCHAAAALGNRALARVKFLIYDSNSGQIGAKLYGFAHRIDDPAEAEAALDIVNDYRHGRGDEPRSLKPDSEVGDPYSMYVADIYRVTATMDYQEYTPAGWQYKRSAHTDVELAALRGFDFPARPRSPLEP